MRVLTDPFLRPGLGPLERHGPLPDPGDLDGVDIVVISHGHPDHLDPASLAAIPGRPLVVVPRGLGRTARGGDGWRCRRGRRGRSAGRRPAVDHGRAGSPLGLAGRPAGAAARLPHRGRRARVVRRRHRPLRRDAGPGRVGSTSPCCPSGPGVPTSARAISARGRPPRCCGEVGPSAAVPIHWGTLYPRRLHRLWPGPLAEPGDRFAGHAARLAPDVDVRVLRPGEGTSIVLPAARPDRS